MTFLWPTNLVLVLVVPALIAAYIWAQRRRQKYALRYASLSLVREALGRGPGRKRHVPPALFLTALLFMAIATARPEMTVVVPVQEGTIVLALDVSGSMLAEDLKPNRMQAAKEAAKAFVVRQGKDTRLGVVAFSTDAQVVQSPTSDKELVIAAIDRLRPQRATAIGRGVLASLDAIFEDTEEVPPSVLALRRLAGEETGPAAAAVPRGADRTATIVLLSDGQNNQFPSPQLILEDAVSRGIRVFTVGVGSAEGTIVRIQGRSVRTRLDEATLRLIADATGGEYFNAANEKDLRAVYENLTTQLVLREQRTEVTAILTAMAAVLSMLAAALSLFWFNRIP
ncbi:MAG TPA: VWA domain-containing protein [Candidatus Limnocylindria bacterium]|nr:VWA domain-containing protein [Candidatus Limnocylindria bacterium]